MSAPLMQEPGWATGSATEAGHCGARMSRDSGAATTTGFPNDGIPPGLCRHVGQQSAAARGSSALQDGQDTGRRRFIRHSFDGKGGTPQRRLPMSRKGRRQRIERLLPDGSRASARPREERVIGLPALRGNLATQCGAQSEPAALHPWCPSGVTLPRPGRSGRPRSASGSRSVRVRCRRPPDRPE